MNSDILTHKCCGILLEGGGGGPPGLRGRGAGVGASEEEEWEVAWVTCGEVVEGVAAIESRARFAALSVFANLMGNLEERKEKGGIIEKKKIHQNFQL